jgi:hypothetical protein
LPGIPARPHCVALASAGLLHRCSRGESPPAADPLAEIPPATQPAQVGTDDASTGRRAGAAETNARRAARDLAPRRLPARPDGGSCIGVAAPASDSVHRFMRARHACRQGAWCAKDKAQRRRQGGAQMNRTIRAAFVAVALLAATWANAVTVTFTATPLGGATWRYDYSIGNDTLAGDIEEFTIYFPPDLYANLVGGATPGWDILVVQPDPQIPDDGFYDGLTLGPGGIAPGATATGFSITFEYLGQGNPGTQAFEVVDPQTFAPLFAGSTVAAAVPHDLTDPDALAFGGQSMFTRSLPRSVAIDNSTGAPVSITGLVAGGPFALASHDCGALPRVLAPGEGCAAQLTFTPPGEGPFDGTFTVGSSVGDAVVPLSGIGERSLVVHYYGSILSRYPEPSGKAYWEGEAARVQALGADLNEVWYAMAIGFFNSPEYIGFNRSNGEFVDDLYRTFLNREADAQGRDFWLGQFNDGLTREVVLVAFMFSQEFRDFTASIFGNTAVRRELDAVMDFYRGLLARLPDGGGFDFWVQRFRTAQCSGSAAVTAEAEAISGEFARGAEYAGRNRSNSEYVGDLYNAILRRGGDGPGVQFWINLIASGAQTREEVRQQFVQSPEFQGRVLQIIAEGCLP